MKLYARIDDGLIETTLEAVVLRLREFAKPPRHNEYMNEMLEGIEQYRSRQAADVLNHLCRWLKPVGIKEIFTVHEYRLRMVEDTLVARCLERLGGDKELIIEVGWGDEDGNHSGAEEKMLSDLLREIHQSHLSWMSRGWRKQKGFEPSPLRSFNKLSQVYEAAENTIGDCCLIFIGTQEEFKKREAERRRKELEGLAAEIAHKHGVKVNTLDFLVAIDKELRQVSDAHEEWNNPERRMEEWAACRYAGVGQDVYFDDLNFVNGRINSRDDDLQAIREWVSENCPLLFAQYEERLAAQNDEEENEEA